MKKRFITTLTLLIALQLSVSALAQDVDSSTNPKPASASLYNLGLKSYENGDLDTAVTYFKKSIDLDPNFVDAYFNLGAIYKKKGDYIGAVSAFQNVVNLDGEDNEAVYELATCFYNQKNYSKAKQYYSMIPTTYPKYNQVQENLSKISGFDTSSPVTAISNSNNEISNRQAEILVDRLANDAIMNEQVSVGNDEISKAIVQEEIFANALPTTKPAPLKGDYKIVSSDFAGPTGVAKDSRNNIYIANFIKNTIERIFPNGERETFLSDVGLDGPVGLAVDEYDNLYAANYGNGTVIKITPERKVLAVMTQLKKPYYLFYDKSTNTLFVTTQGSNALVQINTNNVTNMPISFK